MKKESVIDITKKLLLNSTLLISKKVFNCFSSATENGAIINRNIALDDYNALGMGYGLKALEHIHTNTEIMRIPIGTGLNGVDMVDMLEDERKKVLKQLCNNIASTIAPEGPERERMYQVQSLVWQVMHNSQYEEATNNALISAFPTEDLTQIIYMKQEHINHLSSLNMKIYISYTTHFYKSIYEMVKKESIFDADLNFFIWAYNNVISRKLSVKSPKQSVEVILPILDYINHSSVDPNVTTVPYYDIKEDRSYVLLNSTREIQEGEQLFRFYGEDSNRNYMNKYGFFDKDNKRKDLNIFYTQHLFELILNEQIVQEYLYLMKQAKPLKEKLFKNNNVDLVVSDSIEIYPNKFDNEILKYLRIIFLSEEECIKAAGHDFGQIFSMENEIKVFKFLKVIFDKHFSLIKNNNYTNKIDALGEIDNVDKFKVKNLLLLEEEEQFILSKNVEYINKKLNTLI
jgi:hypothetical protein